MNTNDPITQYKSTIREILAGVDADIAAAIRACATDDVGRFQNDKLLILQNAQATLTLLQDDAAEAQELDAPRLYPDGWDYPTEHTPDAAPF